MPLNIRSHLKGVFLGAGAAGVAAKEAAEQEKKDLPKQIHHVVEHEKHNAHLVKEGVKEEAHHAHEKELEAKRRLTQKAGHQAPHEKGPYNPQPWVARPLQ